MRKDNPMKQIILYVVVFFPVKLLCTQPSPQVPANPVAPNPSAVAAATIVPPATTVPPATPAPGATAAVPAAGTPEASAATLPAVAPDAAAAAAATATTAAPAQDIVPEQLTWPDTADLAEDAPTPFQNNNPKVIELFRKLGASFDKAAEIIDPLVTTRADLYQKYFELDAKLDEFFQNIGLDEGILQGISPVDIEPNATPTPSNLDTYKQEFEKINAQLGIIATTKDSLKKKLSTLDSEIEKSKSALFQARKQGLEILKQTTEAEAQGIYDTINKDLETIIATQKNLQTESTKDFQTNYDKIQADIEALQTLVGQLRAKVIIPEETPAPTPQPPTDTAATNPATPTTPGTPPLTPVPPQQSIKDSSGAVTTSPHATSQAPFHHYLLARMTELFTGAMHVASTTYTTLKDTLHKSIITKQEQAVTQIPKQNSVTVPPTVQTTPTPQTSPAPEIQQATTPPPTPQVPPVTPAPQTPPVQETPTPTPVSPQVPPATPAPETPTQQTPPVAPTPPAPQVTPTPQPQAPVTPQATTA